MTQEQRAKHKGIFLQFQNDWNLDRVKKITLEEYTGIMSEGKRNDFTYFLEHKIPYDFGGADAGTRFGIYQCKESPKKDYQYDGKYAWKKHLGSNKDEVFKKIKDEIIKTIEFSQNNDIEAIDELDILFFGFKWKIAFAYQDFDNMKIGYIFSEKILRNIAKSENLGLNDNCKISQIHKKLLGDKAYNFWDMLEKYVPLWEKYGENKANKATNNDKGESTMPDELNKIPLNQILYGPPGTGKTYSTIDKALEILKSFDCIDEIPESREEKREIFNAYKEKGQIEFITFHQSFSYEEFVEGIKPVFVYENGDEVENSKNMIYKVKDGIFKELCDKAKSNDKPYTIDTTKTLWRLYTIPNADTNNDYFDECIKNNYVRVSSYNNYGDRLKNEANEGDYIAIPSTSHGSNTIRAFGVLKEMKGEYESENKEYVREVEWLWKAKDKSEILKFGKEVNFGTPAFQRVVANEGKEKILETMQKLLGKKDFETKPHILIIDEINRGNISKILGELITLIEESKRIGKDEELKVRLPYSTDEFGVPSNLYIIGTMNTADRSIALLDTALRRRFEFVEMMPDFSLLSTNCEGVNLQKLLSVMNDRIEFLLDREHTIGHSFFINVTSIEGLKEIFAKKIIPLLQEYFYEDYAKIDAVLNGNGMVKPKAKPEFLSKFNDELDNEKVVYEIDKEWKKWEVKQFVEIYNGKIDISQDSNKSNENGE